MKIYVAFYIRELYGVSLNQRIPILSFQFTISISAGHYIYVHDVYKPQKMRTFSLNIFLSKNVFKDVRNSQEIYLFIAAKNCVSKILHYMQDAFSI